MTEQHLVRIKKDREHPYTMVSNKLANDERLTWAARGMMLYLLSKPDDWCIQLNDLISRSPGGLIHTRTILSELESFGYVERKCSHRKDGTFAWVTTVYEIPRPLPQTGHPEATPIQTTDEPTINGSTIGGFPIDGKPVDILKTELTKEQQEIEDGVPSSIHAQPVEPEITPLVTQAKDSIETRLGKRSSKKSLERSFEQRFIQAKALGIFQEVTSLKLPADKKANALGALWYNPLWEMCELGVWDTVIIGGLIRQAYRDMSVQKLTISAPKSILNVVRSIAAKQASTRASPGKLPGATIYRPPSGRPNGG